MTEAQPDDVYANLVSRRQVLALGGAVFLVNIGACIMAVVFAVTGQGTSMLSFITVNVYGAAVSLWVYAKVWRNENWPRK